MIKCPFFLLFFVQSAVQTSIPASPPSRSRALALWNLPNSHLLTCKHDAIVSSSSSALLIFLHEKSPSYRICDIRDVVHVVPPYVIFAPPPPAFDRFVSAPVTLGAVTSARLQESSDDVLQDISLMITESPDRIGVTRSWSSDGSCKSAFTAGRFSLVHIRILLFSSTH